MVNNNNKYYTPAWLVKKVIATTLILLSGVTINEIIEPSAGDGAFIHEIDNLNIPSKYYDLYPEHQKIIEQDYLKLDLEYKKGRVVIGNPPFGDYKKHLYKDFINKSAEISDYIVFILPSSQFGNNINSGCKLIYSENLGEVEYNGENKVKLKTCLNIYQKSNNCIDKKSIDYIKTYNFKKTNKHKKYFYNGYYWDKDLNKFDCDAYISNFGKIHLTTDKNELRKCKYIGIKILDSNRRNDIIEFLKTFDKFSDEIKSISISAQYFSQKFLISKILKYLY